MARNKQIEHRNNEKVIYRDAISGKFISKNYADRHPKTAVSIRISNKDGKWRTFNPKNDGSRTGGPKRK